MQIPNYGGENRPMLKVRGAVLCLKG